MGGDGELYPQTLSIGLTQLSTFSCEMHVSAECVMLLGLVGATPGGDKAPLLLRGHKAVSKRVVNKGALSLSSVCSLVLLVCVWGFLKLFFKL